MDYNYYSAEELATDRNFIEWVKRPTQTNTAFWEDWLRKHPHKAEAAAVAQKLVKAWMVKLPTPSAGSFENVWEKIQADIVASEEKVIHQPHYVFHWQNLRQWAALFAGIVVCAASLYWVSTRWNTTRYATGKEETKSIVLPDGSTVTLNANSSLSYKGEWKRESARKVYLEGEAFFSVTHQTNHQPFIVQTADHLQVEVLGTTFTVSEHKNNTQVVLNSGKVSLHTNEQAPAMIMHPGELVQVSKASKPEVLRRKVNPTVYSAWKDNQFVFDNTSIGEIAEILESEFGYQVQFADTGIKDRKLTIKMANRDLDVLFAVLAETHDLTIDRQNNRIVISPKELTQ